MKAEEFRDKLIKLISCANEDVVSPNNDNAIVDKSSPGLIQFCEQLIASNYSEESKFIEKEPGANDYRFSIPELTDKTLLIKKDDIEAEDPAVNAIIKNKVVPFTDCLSTVLITEFAYWISINSSFTINHKYKRFSLSSLIVKKMVLFFKQRDYPNKIWIKEGMPVFLMDMTEQQKVVIVAANEKVLDEVKSFLKIEASTTDHKDVQSLNISKEKNSFFSEVEKEGNVIKGAMKISNYENPVKASFDSESDSEKDVEKLIEKSGK